MKIPQTKNSYLGYEITTAGLCPQKNEIEAMLQMEPHATRTLLQVFLGIFHYYSRLHPTSKINMQPLVSLTSPKIKFKRNNEANASFNNMK